jgi:hypothetical protein
MKSDGMGLRLGPQGHQINQASNAADALCGFRASSHCKSDTT